MIEGENDSNIRKVRTIEERGGECETDLSYRMVTASMSEDVLVSVEYRGLGTITQEEAGNCKHFIDEAYGGDLLAVCVEVHCAGWRMH